jgi:ATP-dependent helicase/nuclease subunit B
MANPSPRVFTIPASAPFLPTLVDALLRGQLVEGFPAARDPLALADATLFLPTRRACRLARDTFLATTRTEAAILPRIVPIGDIDEDEIAFAEAAGGANAGALLDLPPALGGLERKMLLAELIRKWAASPEMRGDSNFSLVANSPAAALSLAGELARLMDDMIMRQVAWDRLDELVPQEFDDFWQKTLRFLKIAREYWPAMLKERSTIEPAERRDNLIAAEAKRLAGHKAPVIAAGSTGSIPATAALLATIARLPYGAVVLPGLDTDLDAATWKSIAEAGGEAAPNHPQFAMATLLARIGVVREAVSTVGAPAAHGRERLASEALRPAEASALWRDRLADKGFAADADRALRDVAAIEAASAEEEALAIAVTLREAMTEPGKTAALVTPDRALARRVLAALARWNVPADDSGGDALPDTPGGVFARLAAEAALEGLLPVTLLALLKHPLCAVAEAGAVATLERAVLRGPRPKSGTAGLAAALETFRAERARLHRTDPRRFLNEGQLDAAAKLVARLKAALAPLETLPRRAHAFRDLAERHAQVLVALGGIPEEMAAAFEEIIETGSLSVEPSDYAELFEAATADRKVRRPEADVRVRIYGAIEARLQSVDRLVLGGLVEGVWPPETRGDPWLSRPMRHALGLDLPERRIGLSAHDFAQALGAKEIILTRAAKLGGTPTVASRFVQRLAAVAGEARWKDVVARGAHYAELSRRLDEPAATNPWPRPGPKPPLAARPRRLSVTEIEDLLRDPYTIYAKHVLDLQPLDAIDTPPGAADRGTLIHDSIGEFATTYPHPGNMPDDPVAVLREIGERRFRPLAEFPEARAFWWPRFLRIAEWLARFETARRARLARFDVEIGGSIEIPFGGEAFKLTVRADRIEHLKDGRFIVLDYKTGAPPSDKQVLTGLSPQLTLEAAILRKGGFKEIPGGGTVAGLVYVRLRGGAIAGEELPVRIKDGTPDDHADKALVSLTAVLAKFADEANPYYSLLHPMWSNHYGTYDHLARVQEWSLTGATNEDPIFE